MKDVVIDTLEMHGETEVKASWVIPETLPFNCFIDMIEKKEETQKINIGVRGSDILLFKLREKHFAKCN